MAPTHPGRLLLLCLLLAGLPAARTHAAADTQIRVSVNQANGSPFVLYDDNGKFRGGIARDIIEHLAGKLGRKPVYLDLPRARVEPWLRTGKIDAACFLAPEWVSNAAGLRWSPALFHIRQVIVSPAGAKPVTGPRALFGKRLGTILNYTYPELEPYFASGRIERSDAPSLASNIAKLERGRIDAFLYDDLSMLYAAAHGGLRVGTRIDPLWAPENPVYCAFSPAFSTREPEFRTILQDAVDAGRVQRWISAYTGGRNVPARTER